MNIVLYSWPFAPSIGGLERLTEMTANHVVRAGHHVTVVTTTPDPGNAARPFPFQVERRPGLRRLVQLISRADIIQLNSFSAVILTIALLTRRRIVWQHIDFDVLSPRGICHASGRPCRFRPWHCYACLRRDHPPLGAVRSILSLFAKRAAVHFVAINLISTHYARQRMPLPRAEFLSFGIDTDRWVPVERAPASRLRILFYGRHIPAKGCDVLIRAVRRCQDDGVLLSVRIAGDGPQRPGSERLAAELGVDKSVIFIGYRTDDELVAELQSADVVTIPPLQDEIGQFVAFEAMACGCAVIASEIGALPEQLAGAGLFFPPGDDKALAEHLKALAYDPGPLASLARRGRDRVLASFDSRAMGNRYLELYSTVTRKRGKILRHRTQTTPAMRTYEPAPSQGTEAN